MRSELQRCEGCVHYDPFDPKDRDSGICRRRSPEIVPVAEPAAPWASPVMSVWPSVKKTDWCGEFNPRKTAGARQPH